MSIVSNKELDNIKSAISKGHFNLDQLNELRQFIVSVSVSNAKSQIKVGDSVYVVQKTKKTLGVITDIKIKKALVRMNGSMYNVPLSMIEPVEEL